MSVLGETDASEVEGAMKKKAVKITKNKSIAADDGESAVSYSPDFL